jgi:receptor protein-tyrosine kinase
MKKSLIEEATARLQQLQQAGIATRSADVQEPVAEVNGRASQARTTRPRPSQPAADERTPAANVRVIDLARLQAGGFITPNTKESQLLHEFRIVKRPLVQNALGKGAAPIANGNLIMVTSSLPGEGKSFCALNLAMSMAQELDCRVLFVDADVVRPSVPRLLGIQPAKGLMDVLTTPDLDLGEVLLKTNVPRLQLLLAGTPHPNSSELLASAAMNDLLQSLATRYADRIILFDSPPLLATTESRVLAAHMGQVVMVVEAERTTHGVLESALATVEACPVLMTLLNKAPRSEAGSYYGYYGYGR